MLQVIQSEWGYMLVPVFDYMSDLIEWQDGDQSMLPIFNQEFKSRYQAEKAAEREGYEIVRQEAESLEYLAV